MSVNLSLQEYLLDRLSQRTIWTDPSQGWVFSSRFGKLRGRIDSDGYVRYQFWRDGVKLHTGGHVIIWLSVNKTIIPEPLLVDHINLKKIDNRINNLRLLSPIQSSVNRVWYKLQPEDIPHIRSMISEGVAPRVIAAAWGISLSTVSEIKHKKRWAWA